MRVSLSRSESNCSFNRYLSAGGQFVVALASLSLSVGGWSVTSDQRGQCGGGWFPWSPSEMSQRFNEGEWVSGQHFTAGPH